MLGFVPLGSNLPQSPVYMGKEERGFLRTDKEKEKNRKDCKREQCLLLRGKYIETSYGITKVCKIILDIIKGCGPQPINPPNGQ